MTRFFRFCSVFSGLARFFFSLDSVRFGFFGFRLIKPKPNRTGRFFQNLNGLIGFFFTVRFFWLFCFSGFLGLIGFSIFLLTPSFDVLMLRMNLKNKKYYYFNIFSNKKHFKNMVTTISNRF
jgi:hypothetical protein